MDGRLACQLGFRAGLVEVVEKQDLRMPVDPLRPGRGQAPKCTKAHQKAPEKEFRAGSLVGIRDLLA
jgi:hypothetical protein